MLFSAIRLITVLGRQWSTLEEYTFTGRVDYFRSDMSIYGSLRNFTAMKRVAVPVEHFVLRKAEFENLSRWQKNSYVSIGISPTSLFQQLPGKLEQHCLLVEWKFRWFIERRLLEQVMTISGMEPRDWLPKLRFTKSTDSQH